MPFSMRENHCPSCGTLGAEMKRLPLKECGTCGTVYNKFGVIFNSSREDDLQWT